MSWFGALGSRSRNGWGSLIMDDEKGGNLEEFSVTHISSYMRELEKCLKCDWPHAIGMDNGNPLLWMSSEKFKEWPEAINHLAELKYKMREAAKKHRSKNANGYIAGIHFLGYPAGKNWELRGHKNLRLPSPIRFKIVLDESKHYICRVFHIPTGFPKDFIGKLSGDEKDWINKKRLSIYREIHQTIETHSNMERCK